MGNKDMKTKEELLTRGKGNFINCTDYDDAIKSMQSFSDQETARLTAINEKQGELIELIDTHYAQKFYNNALSGFKYVELSEKEAKLRTELASLQSGKEPDNCIHFDECQGRNHCLTDKVKSVTCIGVDCGHWNDGSLKAGEKEEAQWHLNCTKCEKPYWDRQPFPAFQLCPECKSIQSVKDKIKPFIANEEPVVNKWIREDAEKQTADSVIDLQQYVTNLLYYARNEANSYKLSESSFDQWVEGRIDLLKEYAQHEKAIEVTDEEINAYAEKYQNYIHVRNFDRGLKQGIKHGAKWLRDKLKGL
jgi:hypothetical protein